jgi:signal transduction histidine kinase
VDRHKLVDAVTAVLHTAARRTSSLAARGEIRIIVVEHAGAIAIDVVDNGAAMPAGQLEAMFRQRGELHDAATSIQLLGGRLRATSDGDSGARFHIEIPIAVAPRSRLQRQSSITPKPMR